jgi:hypothetical protein
MKESFLSRGQKQSLFNNFILRSEKMNVSMKYWKIGVYFGSIALAVGIGVFTTTAREVGRDSCNSSSPYVGNCKNIVNKPMCEFAYYRKVSGTGYHIGGDDNVCYRISAGAPADAPSECGTLLSSNNNNELGTSRSTDCE